MQPLFAHNRLLLTVLLASLLIWRVMEASVDIRTRKRLRAGAQRQDKGSHVALLCLIVFGILLGVLLAFKVPTTSVTSAPDILFWLGILLMGAGIALRFYAITVLGAFL
jgi:protein-S-isoprenylcysteine O-methyltransferase Ste14